MSADNWTICPKCKADAFAKRRRLQKQVVESYGKLPQAKYAKLIEDANAEIELEDSLREDYGLGIDKFSDEESGTVEATFVVSYRAACQDCGFRFEFQHKQPVDLKLQTSTPSI